jgi:hypothetical protein
MVHLIHQLPGQVLVLFFAGLPVELQEVANGESIRPQVALGSPPGGRQAGETGEFGHNPMDDVQGGIPVHFPSK